MTLCMENKAAAKYNRSWPRIKEGRHIYNVRWKLFFKQCLCYRCLFHY